VGKIETPTYQIEIMFNRSRWANNCTVTPLFYIFCYGAFFIMEFAISVLGYVLLWAATDVGRKDGKEIKFMRGKWWLIFGLITTGAYIIKYSESWF
jgi:hypothetical protein